MENEQITGFIEWLVAGDIILSYWSPARNELMPIEYTAEALAGNFAKGKEVIGGKVKRIP